MTNYFRKDVEPILATPEVLPANAAAPINDRNVPDPDKRPLSVPPAPVDSAAATQSTGAGAAVARARQDDRVALFMSNEANDLRARWGSIQVGFVDQPRKAVEDADALVATTTNRLSEMFAAEREKLERQWGKNESISTEDLRVTLQRYRSFFSRLLTI
ncbi:MAG: hypothetical protein WA823_16720 [Candidatus Acidiferrales bacterium]